MPRIDELRQIQTYLPLEEKYGPDEVDDLLNGTSCHTAAVYCRERGPAMKKRKRLQNESACGV